MIYAHEVIDITSSDHKSSPLAPSLWKRVRDLYAKCRPWAIGVFVFLGLLSPLFPAEFRYIPLTALLGVVAQALLEILAHVMTPATKPYVRTVSDVIEALPDMEKAVGQCRKDQVQLRSNGLA